MTLRRSLLPPCSGFGQILCDSETIDLVTAEPMLKMGIHEGMLALGKANISLKLLAQVRNKVMTAYNEVMRMQV